MSRLTRAELVDLVRRLVESLGDGGLSRATVIEAENALKAEAATLSDGWKNGSYRLLDGHLLATVKPPLSAPTFRPDAWTWSVWHLYEGFVGGGPAATEHEAQQAALDAAKELAGGE